MMNGGNILVLQRLLGHTDIKMTMRYAHFPRIIWKMRLNLTRRASYKSKLNEFVSFK